VVSKIKYNTILIQRVMMAKIGKLMVRAIRNNNLFK
jgi:hypothetical protein